MALLRAVLGSPLLQRAASHAADALPILSSRILSNCIYDDIIMRMSC
jgi:hypothetical protein